MLKTARLKLREVVSSDADFILRLYNTDGFLKFVGDRQIRDHGNARDYIRYSFEKSYSERGFGLWLVEVQQTGQPIGVCGLVQRDYLDAPDLGFGFLPEVHGQGYAYEAAAAVIVWAQRQGWFELYGVTMPTNQRSIQLLTKLGFSLIKQMNEPHSGVTLSIYALASNQPA